MERAATNIFRGKLQRDGDGRGIIEVEINFKRGEGESERNTKKHRYKSDGMKMEI